MNIGAQLPDISLKDQEGNPIHLKNYIGRPLVVFFYPKDETVGCTIEVCAFRDHYQEFVDLGATVVGISRDSVKSHKRFWGRQHLTFSLLSDIDGIAIEAFGVPRKLFGLLPGRVTFIFDSDGKLIHSFDSSIGFKKHLETSLSVLKDHQQGSKN
jgi:peroxiredoxin Q/BCP